MEQTIINLNKKAMEHLSKEKLFGYGLVDETKWQEHMTKGTPDLLNSFNTVRHGVSKNHASIQKTERSVFNGKTSIF